MLQSIIILVGAYIILKYILVEYLGLSRHDILTLLAVSLVIILSLTL